MAVARQFRIGSATVAFAIASCAWFVFVWTNLLKMLSKTVTNPESQAIRYALIATVPMVVVTAIASITVNVSQSEGLSWLFAVLAFLIGAVGCVVWMAPYLLVVG
jgi:hypothetical protein